MLIDNKEKLFISALEYAWASLPYFDVSIPDHLKLFQSSFLKYLVNNKEVTVKSALDDLKVNNTAT